MRRPRDPSTLLRSAYDAELKALDDKARQLRQKRIVQLGELVIACGADGLPPEQLAGALIAAQGADAQTLEGWRQRGTAFFQQAPRKPARRTDHMSGRPSPIDGDTTPA